MHGFTVNAARSVAGATTSEKLLLNLLNSTDMGLQRWLNERLTSSSLNEVRGAIRSLPLFVQQLNTSSIILADIIATVVRVHAGDTTSEDLFLALMLHPRSIGGHIMREHSVGLTRMLIDAMQISEEKV